MGVREGIGPVKQVAAVFAAADISGRWTNDGGTIIELRSHADGRLSGSIRFSADGTAYKPYEMRGTCIERADGNSGIVGTVSGWPHQSSVTVWCAELDSQGDLLTKLLTAGGTPPPLDWESATGGSVFRRADAVRRRRSA